MIVEQPMKKDIQSAITYIKSEVLGGLSTVTTIDPDEKKLLFQQWGKKYGVFTRNKDYTDPYRHCYWHVFSYNIWPHQSANEAEESYRNAKSKNFYLLVSNMDIPAYLIEKGSKIPVDDLKRLIDNQSVIGDIYVVSKDFSWTLVITHEEYFGPYFARGSNHSLQSKYE